MKTPSAVYLLLLCLAFIFNVQQSIGQNSSLFWIDVTDNRLIAYSRDSVRMWFGNYTDATHGYDSLTPRLIEREHPPLNVSFDTRWENSPGRDEFSPLGAIFWNFYEPPATPEKKDTFVLYMQNPDSAEADFTLYWPDVSYLGERCDSMFLVSPGNLIRPVNMFTQNNVVVPGSLGIGAYRFRIYKYGLRMVDDPASISGTITGNSSMVKHITLLQNYPNPFNPTTTLQFEIDHSTLVSLKVYDVLGHEVSTLVNKPIQPGSQSVTFDGSALASGIYYYKLSGAEFVVVKKMVLIK